MKRVTMALAALSLLGGCSIIHGRHKPRTPTIGQRIPVLSTEASIEVDPGLADIAVTLPPPVENADWAQPGGSPSKSMGHLALGAALGEAWSVRAGQASTPRIRLSSSPVVVGNRIYAMDAMATVRAFDTANGRLIWEHRVGNPKDTGGGMSLWSGEYTGNSGALFGGGVSFDNGRLYATNGVGDVEAIEAATGKVVWRVRPSGPISGAPTIANDNLYIVTEDNQLLALNPADGSQRWQQAGSPELAGEFGAAAPAAAQGTVVAGFSSGELNAFRYENGRPLWGDVLTRTSISTTVGTLTDIDAAPVIDSGRVYAIGAGGRMVAMDLITGQRVWEINAAGRSTPWVAGDWVFVITDQAQLLCIARASGKVRWMTQLRRYRDQKDKKDPIFWTGPVLAGGRLIVANSRGELVNVAVADGAVQTTVRTKDPILLPPIVAGHTLYTFSEGARLTAWR